jgi:hypothetical protein
LAPLAARCREKGVEFSCTPFYLEAVKQLEPHVAFYKVASYELLWTDLLKACAATGKPVIISTGMAIMPEIKAAVATLENAGAKDVTVLHCVSAYPSPPEQSNLSAIQTIRKATGARVGWSDHSRVPAVIERAVHHWNAETITPAIAGCRTKSPRSSAASAKGCWPTARASRSRCRRSFPTANGAPIRWTACVPSGMCAKAGHRPDGAPGGRRHPGAHGLVAPARQGVDAGRGKAAAVAHPASPE